MMGFGFYNMDCVEGMGQFPDNYFDLAIVDPPYGIGDFNMKTGAGVYKPKTKCNVMPVTWNNNIPPKEYFDELKRISSKRIVWGANYYNIFEDGGAIVWYKNIGHKSLSQCEIASVSWQKRVNYFAFKKLNGFLAPEKYIHPCQKPVELYRWILLEYAKAGWKILDTHVGSASSLIACEWEGFDYIGFEKDPDYYAAATKRMENWRKSRTLDLFKDTSVKDGN